MLFALNAILFPILFPEPSLPLSKGNEGSGNEIGNALSQSPISYPKSSGFLVSEATPGRLWGHRILLPQDFCGKTMETVTEQPIKKIEFFRCPQSLPGVAPLTKKPEDSGYEIAQSLSFPAPLDKGNEGSGNEIALNGN